MGVVWTKEALDSDTLIARADDAMYESKRLGDHGVTFFADSDQVGAFELCRMPCAPVMGESSAVAEPGAAPTPDATMVNPPAHQGGQ